MMRGELLVSRAGGRTLAALREDGQTVELRAEDEGGPFAVGRILKARVSKVLPGIQSAFLDVGLGRDAFLHASDLLLPGESVVPEPGEAEDLVAAAAAEAEPDAAEGPDEDGDAPVPARAPKRRNAVRVPIEQRLREGREILVQISRESLGAKGARATCFVSLPGRYLVHMPQVTYRGLSRRIADPDERARLRGIITSLPSPSGGFIVRTAAEGASPEALAADARRLVATWEKISADAAAVSGPALVHEDHDLLLRLLRDLRREGMDRIVVDDPADHARAAAYLRELDPVLAQTLRLHTGPELLFDAEGVAADVERALRPKVWLRSGGSIVIEPTEALVSVDVNTGKFVGSRRPEETIVKTNLEAAAEIARQLRLRDLGGIIVVDFIDMDLPESRAKVLESFASALRRDRARTKVLGISDLGLVELTRKRTRPGVHALLTRPCPVCQGSGRVKNPETVAGDALGEARRVGTALPGETVRIRAHPDVARAVRAALRGRPAHEDGALDARVEVEDDPTAMPDQFDLLAGS